MLCLSCVAGSLEAWTHVAGGHEREGVHEGRSAEGQHCIPEARQHLAEGGEQRTVTLHQVVLFPDYSGLAADDSVTLHQVALFPDYSG